MRSFRFVLVVLLCGATLSAQKKLDLTTLLDRYAAGEVDAVVAAVNKAEFKEINSLRDRWKKEGEAWIKRGDKAARRRFVAAALALGIEVAVVEHGGWYAFPREMGDPCRGRCVLTWAAGQLAPMGSEPDPAERAWWIAAAALAHGVGEGPFLLDVLRIRIGLRTADPSLGVDVPIVLHGKDSFLGGALARFPDDVELKFLRALVMTAPFVRRTDGVDRSIDPESPVLKWPREDVIAQWVALTKDSRVGLDARIRLAHLRWSGGEDGLALAELDKAIERALEPDDVYLAHVIAGFAAQSVGAADRAREHFNAALNTRPGSESASLALAAIELESDRPDQAMRLMEAVGARGRDDHEPWRQFAYGPYTRMAQLMTRVRAEVR